MWAMQDYEGAHRSSKYARNLNIAGIVGSFVCLVIVAISLGLFFGLYSSLYSMSFITIKINTIAT